MNIYDIHDDVYGDCIIREPVLVDLLHSSALQRLQGIHQAGGSYLVRARRDITRYEHSVGVMLLIRLLGGSIEEQIAGLIHDVSHTAFSHVADYVFQQREEDFHDQHFTHLMLRSDIPRILEHHAIATNAVFPLERWSLLEQPIPDLCADRVDYTLRDLLRFDTIDVIAVKHFLKQLQVHEGKIICQNLQAAIWFTRHYDCLINKLFLHPLELFADEQLARAIRIALTEGILRKEDLFLRDNDVLRILQTTQQPDIAHCLAMLGEKTEVVEDKNNFDMHVHIKERFVDPLVLQEDGQMVRCSVLEPSLQQLNDQTRQRTSCAVRLRIVSSNVSV